MTQSIKSIPTAPTAITTAAGAPEPEEVSAPGETTTAGPDAAQGPALEASAAGLGIVHDEIELSIRLARAPVDAGTVGNAATSTLSTNALNLGRSDAHLEITRNAAMLQMPMNNTGTLVGHAGVVSGLLYGSVSQQIGNTTLTGFQGNIGRVSATGLSTTTTLANVNLSSGVALVGSGDASLKVDEYHEGRMLMVYKDHFAGSLQITGGVSMGYVGFGLRLGITGRRGFEFRTWMTADEAAGLLKKTGRTQEVLSMLRMRRNLIALPNLADPLNQQRTEATRRVPFNVGDELRLTYTGTLTGGIAVTGAGVYVGAHVSLTGTHTISVQKASETEVVVDVIPKQITRASSLAADFPLVAEAHLVLAQSKATRYSYRFDLTKPAAMQAYKKALEGTLPGPVANCDGYRALSGEQAQRIVLEAVMPEGVVYELLEQAAVPYERTSGVSVTLPKFVPFANLAGYGVEQRLIHEQSVIAGAQGAVQNDSISRIRETQALHKGTSETTSFGTLKSARSSTDDLMTLEGVTLGVTLSYDRTRRDSRNRMVKTLNNVLFKQKPLNWFEGPSKISKYNYEVTLQRHVPVDTLASLAPEGRSLYEQAEILREEVSSGGVSGFASVLEKIGTDVKDIDVKVNSRAPEAIWDKVLQLSARYNTAINPKEQKIAEISTRIGKVNKYLELIKIVRQDIDKDVLLNTLDKTSKVQQVELLGATHSALLRLVKFKDLGPQLYDTMKNNSARRIRKILEKWEAQPPVLPAA